MSTVRLTCEETPLAWPASVDIGDLTSCSTCGIKITTLNPGTLQALTRRLNGGVGDGVNIVEDPGLGADYRGQRYTLEEAILHAPGMHVFPGSSDVPPAEYHIHMTTFAQPTRSLTIVFPVSHLVTGPGQDYFAAVMAQPDAAAVRPTFQTLLIPGTATLQYQGPDLRGRTKDVMAPESCNATDERQIIMVMQPLQISAADLERIPRIASLSLDPRDLPALQTFATKKIPRDRIKRTVVLAQPGILDPNAPVTAPVNPNPAINALEMQCRPLKVVNGRDVVDISGTTVDLSSLLSNSVGPSGSGGDTADAQLIGWDAVLFSACFFVGLIIASEIFTLVWFWFFTQPAGSNILSRWEPLKFWFFLIMSLSAGGISTYVS